MNSLEDVVWVGGEVGEAGAHACVSPSLDGKACTHAAHAPEAVARPLFLQRRVVIDPTGPQARVVVGVGVDHRDALPLVPIHGCRRLDPRSSRLPVCLHSLTAPASCVLLLMPPSAFLWPRPLLDCGRRGDGAVIIWGWWFDAAVTDRWEADKRGQRHGTPDKACQALQANHALPGLTRQGQHFDGGVNGMEWHRPN